MTKVRNFIFFPIIVFLSLASCNNNTSSNSNTSSTQEIDYEANCSSEKLTKLGVDLMGDKKYNQDLGGMVYEGYHVIPIEFKAHPDLYAAQTITLEFTKGSKLSYLLADFKDGQLSGDCLRYDLKKILNGADADKVKKMGKALGIFLR